MWEARWAPVTGGFAQGLGQQGRLRPGPLIPGMGGQDLAGEGGPTPGSGLGCDVGPLSAWGDELPGQVRQHHCGGVGAGDGDGLLAQGLDDGLRPRGVAPAPVPC